MSSILVRADDGNWTGIQPGRVHAGSDFTLNTGGHYNTWTSKPVDSKLIGKDVIVTGHLTMVDFTPSGAFCAGVRATTGFASVVETFYSNREWTGGDSNTPGGNRRTGYFPFMLLGRLTSATITLQVRVDMGGAGTIRLWFSGDNQSNIFVCPVHTL